MVNGPAQGLLKAVLAGTMATGDTVHPIEAPLESTVHEATTIADPHLHQGSAGHTGVVATGQTCLCLLHIRLATAKVVTVVTVVGTAIETEKHPAISATAEPQPLL